MHNYAPVALFVYNRPQHASRTIDALRRNTLATHTDLVVFSDAARSALQQSAVNAVRAQLHGITGFRSVRVVEREENFGLARSIIEGVSVLLAEFGRVIVLEDDLETSPHFLAYMNDALEHYADESSVMHISGYIYPMQTKHLPETFFLAPTSCWGWATWARAWTSFAKDSAALMRDMDAKQIRAFNLDGAYDYFAQVRLNHLGLLNTWAVFWYATVFRAGGLCLHPRTSLVRNIGHDGSGEHCDISTVFDVELVGSFSPKLEDHIELSAPATASLKQYFRQLRPPLWKRALARVKRVLRGHP